MNSAADRYALALAQSWSRVVLVRDVERYPFFIAPKGSTGTIVHADAEMIAIRLDEFLPGAEEWDNEVCFYACADGFGGFLDEVRGVGEQ